jgi:hypothetical protein
LGARVRRNRAIINSKNGRRRDETINIPLGVNFRENLSPFLYFQRI